MITRLTIDRILLLVKSTPEQAVFDSKTEFTPPRDDYTRGEIIKDLCAVANALTESCGYIFYGLDIKLSDPLRGINNHYDDSNLQQLVQGKVEPPIEFLYYEVPAGTGRDVGVIHIQPSRRRPHVIRVDLDKIRKGQILIRRGSSTDGITRDDLLHIFYGDNQHTRRRIEATLGECEANLNIMDNLGKLFTTGARNQWPLERSLTHCASALLTDPLPIVQVDYWVIHEAISRLNFLNIVCNLWNLETRVSTDDAITKLEEARKAVTALQAYLQGRLEIPEMETRR